MCTPDCKTTHGSRCLRLLTTSLLTLLVSLLTPASSLASETYVLDLLMTSFLSRGSCLTATHLAVEGAPFFSVNQLGIPTFTVPGQFVSWPNGDERNLFQAPFSSALFNTGANRIDFSIRSSADDQTCVDALDVVTLRSPSFGARQIFYVERRGFAFTGSTAVNLTLEQLNPPLARHLAEMLEFIHAYGAELVASAGTLAQRDAEIAARLDALARLEEDLEALAEQKGYANVVAADLEAIFARYPDLPEEGRARLALVVNDLHKQVGELRAEVNRVMDVFSAQADSVADTVTQRARQAGWDPHDSGNYTPHMFGEEVPEVETTDVGAGSVFDGSDNPYDHYADGILEDLGDTLVDGQVDDRDEFASIVASWRRNQAAIERIIRERTTVNLAESGAFVQAQNRVLSFVRNYMDEGDWFKEAPVSPEVKRLLDGVIRHRFAALAARIKSGMNNWQLHGTREAMLEDMVVASGAVLENGYDGEPDDVKGVVPRILGWAATAVGVGVSLSPVGDVLDACQALTGQENCNPNGRILEDWERVAAGLGVVVFSGKFWQVVGTAVTKARGPATYLAAVVARMPREVAEKWRGAKADVLEGLFSVGQPVKDTVPEGLYNWYRDRASTLLKKALGPPPSPTGFQAHHIVDVLRESDDGAIASRHILAKYNIRINEALNGVWLNKTAHDLTKQAAYGRWVAKTLSTAESMDDVMDLLGEIKATLTNLNADRSIVPW